MYQMDIYLACAFYEELEEWKKHCRQISHSLRLLAKNKDYINCDAYVEIIGMGINILPLIKKECLKPQNDIPVFCWCDVIRNIIPEFDLEADTKANKVQKAIIKCIDEKFRE